MSDLTKDSPAAFKKISQLFKEETDQKIICNAYKLSASHGGKKEIGFKREAGTSFNPRPARLILIILDYTNKKSLETLVIAILACAQEKISEGELEQHQELKEYYSHSLTVTESLSKGKCASAQTDTVSLSHALDLLRHLHQVTDSCFSKDTILNNASELYKDYCNKYPRELEQRLFVIYKSLLERYQVI